MVGICEESMNITGTVKEWKEWSGLEFPQSGKNIIQNALVPVDIDLEKNIGIYIEPNVWIIHQINYES